MTPSPSAPGTYYSLWQMPEHYLLMAPDYTILDASNQYLAATLKQREAIAGRNVFDVFPREEQNDWQVFFDSLEHVRQHATPHTMPRIRYDMQRPAEQGGGLEERYWQTTNYPQFGPQGQLQAILLKTEDVTAQHRAAQQAAAMQHDLLESQERSHFILESLPVMVWTTRADGSADYFNQRWLTFTGKPMEAEIESGWLDGVHPDDRAGAAAAWRGAYESGHSYQTEYRLHCANGDYRWVLARGIPRHSAAGEVTMWVGCSIDIHEQKLMVQELLHASEEQAVLSDQSYQAYQLAQSQRETFHTLFMQAPALIAIMRGPNYVFELANPLYGELLPGREFLGRPMGEVIPEVVEQGFVALLDQVYQTGEPFYGKEILARLQRHPTAPPEDRYFDFTYQAFKEHGTIVGIFVFAFEVTELVQARQQLKTLVVPPPAAS